MATTTSNTDNNRSIRNIPINILLFIFGFPLFWILVLAHLVQPPLGLFSTYFQSAFVVAPTEKKFYFKHQLGWGLFLGAILITITARHPTLYFQAEKELQRQQKRVHRGVTAALAAYNSSGPHDQSTRKQVQGTNPNLYSVVGYLVTQTGEVLLARRGPESNPPEQRGKFAAIGGKHEENESAEDCLAREVLEEVGYSITKSISIPIATEVHPEYSLQSYAVAVEKFEPSVPPSEVNKVVDPTWFTLETLPVTEMSNENRVNAEIALNVGPRLFAPAGQEGKNKLSLRFGGNWLDRNTDMLPTTFDLIQINNKDSLCCYYAVNMQLDEQDKKSEEWAATAVPAAGFYPYQIAPPKYIINVWDTKTGTWSIGDGAIGPHRVYLAYTQNKAGGGHYDAMRPSLNPTSPIDTTLYLQGRNGEEAEDQEKPEDREEIIDPEETDDDDLSIDLESEIDEEEKPVNPTDEALLLLTVGKASYIQERRKPGTSAEQIPETYYSWFNKVITIAKTFIQTQVTFSDRTKFFLGLEQRFTAQYESASNGLSSFIDFLRDNSIDDVLHTDMHFPYGQITSYITNLVGSSEHQVPIKMKTAFFGTWHSLTMRPNLRPYSVPEAPHKQAQDLQALFPTIFERSGGNNTAVNVGRYLNSSEDYGSDGMAYIFERLVCGALAATTSCYPSICTVDKYTYPDYANGAWDKDIYVPDGGILFPVHDSTCRYVFEGAVNMNQLPAGLNGARAAPALWFNPQNPGTSGATMLFNTNITGFNAFPRIIRGNSRPGNQTEARDFRAVLANYHTPRMGLCAPVRFRDAANNCDPNHQSVFLRHHDFAVPPLMLVTAASLPAQLGTNQHNEGLVNTPPNGNASTGYQPSALANPNSWFDAIGFMLHHFGGRDHFAIGCQNAFRRCGVFGPSAFQELAIAYDAKYPTEPTADDMSVLERRIAAMRIMRPFITQGITLSNQADQMSFYRLMLAVNHAGPTMESRIARTVGAPGHAQAIAAIRRVFTTATTATLRFGFETDATNFPQDWTNHVKDAAWHQFFSSVDISANQDELATFVSCMTSDEQSSLRAWLFDEEFQDRWDHAGNFGEAGRVVLDAAPGHWSTTAILPNGTVMQGADVDYVVQALRHNADTRQEWNMPSLNIIESAQVTVPSGLSMLRSLRISHDMYHSDNAALVTAEEFWRMSPQHFLEKFVKYNLALRSAADVTAHSMGLTAAALMTRQGNYCTGNDQLDAKLYESTERESIGGMNNLIHSYVQNVCDLILGQGISTSLAADFTTGYIKVQFMDYTHFTNWNTEGGKGATKPESFWIWRALHPLTIACFIPNAITAPTNVVPEAEVLATITSRKWLPWTDWVIAASAMTPFEAFASVRGLLATVGYRIPLKLTITWAEEIAGPAPLVYDVAPWITDMPLRRSDAYPHAPTAMVDPLCTFRFQYNVFINCIRGDDDNYKYIKPTFNFSFLRHVRTTDLPPTLPWHSFKNTEGTYTPEVAILHAQLMDTAPGAHFPANAPWYAGQHYNGRSNISTDTFAVGTYQRLQQGWHSNQESGNVVRTRSFNAFLAQHTERATNGWLPTDNITDSAGTELTQMFTRTGNGSTIRNASNIQARGSIFTYVPKRESITYTEYQQRGAYLGAIRQAIAFVGTIKYKVFIDKPIFILGKYTSQPTAEHTGIYQPFANGASSLDTARSALGDISTVLIPKSEKQIQGKDYQFTGSQIVQAPADTYDLRHFMPAIPLGGSALEVDDLGELGRSREPTPLRTSNLDGFLEVAERHAKGDGNLDDLRNKRLTGYNRAMDAREAQLRDTLAGEAARIAANDKKAAAAAALKAKKDQRARILALEKEILAIRKEKISPGKGAKNEDAPQGTRAYTAARSTSPRRQITRGTSPLLRPSSVGSFLPDF